MSRLRKGLASEWLSVEFYFVSYMLPQILQKCDKVMLIEKRIVGGEMVSIDERLRRIGVSGTHYTRYLQQVHTFREQLHTAFAPADAGRILDALQLMIELHIDQAPRPDGTAYIEHPLAVASQVLEAMVQQDPDVVVALPSIISTISNISTSPIHSRSSLLR
jgi:hypothetical protein